MANLELQNKINVPFADKGDKINVPDTSSEGTVNMTDGFGPKYDTPIAEGGEYIYREEMNEILNKVYAAVKELQDLAITAGFPVDMTKALNVLPVSNGGTGANNASQARSNLGLGSLATKSTITSADITDGTITANDIANNAVTNTKINDRAVTTSKIADTAVTADKLASSAVTNAKIANNTITGAKLANKTITATQIADNTITANQLTPNSVGRDELGTTYSQGVTYTDIDDLFRVFGLQKPVTTAQLVNKMCTNQIETRKAFFQTSYVSHDYISDLPITPVFLTIIYLDANGLVLEARSPFGNKALWVGATNNNNFTGWTKVRGDDGLIYPDNINMGNLMGMMFRIGDVSAGNNSGIGSWGLLDGNQAFQANGSYFNIRWTKNDPNQNAPTFVWVNEGGTVPSSSSDRILACKLQ